MKCLICEMCQSPRNKTEQLKTEDQETRGAISRLNTVTTTKKGTKQKYHEIVTFCNKTGDLFVDDSFPPAPKSLFYSPKSVGKNSDVVIQWIRPKDIVTENGSSNSWVIFRTPLPSDISQGE